MTKMAAIKMFLISLVVFGAVVSPAAGHGHLIVPASRNFRLAATAPFPITNTPQAGNGRHAGDVATIATIGPLQPGVCGDPWQAVNINTQPALANYFRDLPNQPIQATYQPGQRVTFTWRVTANHGGFIGFKICNRNTNLDQACFDANPLSRADGLGTRVYILHKNGVPPCEAAPLTSGREGYCQMNMAPGLDMSADFIIPSNIRCNGACVLQWEYYTYNSCSGGCPDARACSQGTMTYERNSNPVISAIAVPQGVTGLSTCYSAPNIKPERFHNCADIMIGGGPPTPTCTTAPPTAANANPFSCQLPTASGGSCSATCRAGFTGTPVATCNNGAWSVSGMCSSGGGMGCSTAPPTAANANPFSCQLPTASGGSCSATCKTGFTGTPVATCNNGAWGVSGTCSGTGGGGCSVFAAFGGACGAAAGGACCPSGQCCSQWGYCGVTSTHCGAGCQKSFGACSAARMSRAERSTIYGHNTTTSAAASAPEAHLTSTVTTEAAAAAPAAPATPAAVDPADAAAAVAAAPVDLTTDSVAVSAASVAATVVPTGVGAVAATPVAPVAVAASTAGGVDAAAPAVATAVEPATATGK